MRDPFAMMTQEEAELDRSLDAGEMTPEAHAKAVRDLRHECREMAREAAGDAYEAEMGRWSE